jgi:hypothetical protein
MNKKKRTKERKIGEVKDKVLKWRELKENGIKDEQGN